MELVVRIDKAQSAVGDTRSEKPIELPRNSTASRASIPPQSEPGENHLGDHDHQKHKADRPV